MQAFSALLVICEGNSPRPVSFDVFFDLRLNKRLSKPSRRRWFETPSRSQGNDDSYVYAQLIVLQRLGHRYTFLVNCSFNVAHTLGIERGRHIKTEVNERLCAYCERIDDERHFILYCDVIDNERQCLFEKVNYHYPDFRDLDDLDKFKYLLMSENPQILTWLSKFIYVGSQKKWWYKSKS